jgi:hypothetical protein
MTFSPRRFSAALTLALVVWAGALTSCDSGTSEAPNGQAAGADAGTIDLRPDFSKTDVLTYEHTMEVMESRTSAPGSPVISTAQIIRQYSLQPVAREPDGGALIELIVTRVFIVLQAPDGRMVNIDTARLPDGGREDPQTQAIRRLAGLRIVVALNADGSVTEIRGLAEAMAEVGAIPQGMSSFFNESWFRAAAEGVYRAREDASSASIGDTWTITKDSDFGDAAQAAHTTFTSRLISATDDVATIEGSAILELDFEEVDMLNAAGSQIDDQLYEYSKRWDLARGVLLEHTTIQKAQMTLNYGGLRVNVDQSTGSRLARISPDGVSSTLNHAESGGTDVDANASETEDPASEQ